MTVTDNGPGIDPAFLDSIFSRFSRADSARTGPADGTAGTGKTGSSGLGLAIVQALLEANGGTVGVDSRPGCTRFTVVLPAAVPDEPNVSQERHKNGQLRHRMPP
ncbi:ATP-binding protein [Arthrobacter sp. Marseille-P9274]|uniref:ATP-binding protein n=1 Tax=Arthrobacter sp. Marseille-P9274 TaxID=2866572 RepID=UPI0021C874A8|nr:HAMP domain-containing sensor histidine kinase [Arthrobacter sp. Marseille-P9274]